MAPASPLASIVMNKNKPDALRGKVLFINADREFAEGQEPEQTPPRGHREDRLCLHPKTRIAKIQPSRGQDGDRGQARLQPQHPPLCGQHARPEPEDVQAHLIGGVPESEVRPDTATSPNLA